MASNTLNPHNIKYLIVHCTATARGRDFTAADVDRWHRQQGWDMIGYHYLVRLDGTVEQGRPETRVGAHDNGGDLEFLGKAYRQLHHLGKPRQRRPWFNKSWYISIEVLKDHMARIMGDQFTGAFDTLTPRERA